MGPGIKHHHSAQNQEILLNFIGNQLYPAEKYPRTLFPDLPKILYDQFIVIIRSKSDRWERFQKTTDPKILKEMVRDILNLKNLLKNHPHSLILIYRYLISKYIGSKHQKPEVKEDILQEIITRLLADKISKIQNRYDFNFKKIPSFTSYLMVTVRNIHIDIIREGKNRMLKTVELTETNQSPATNDFEPSKAQFFIEEELTKLHYILKMYHKSRLKIELSLKIKFRIPVGEEDVRQCFPGYTPQDESTLTRDFKFIKDKKVFEIINPIYNRYENKKNKSDTIRKWIAVKIDEIITHLNRTHDYDVYDFNNISDLITLYYQKQPLKRAKNEI